MDWKEIAERAQAELEASRKSRENLRALEDRAAEREQRRRAPLQTETRPTAPPEMTPAEKRKAAADALFAYVVQARPVEETAPTTATIAPTNPIAGSIAARIAERDAKDKARSDEKAAATATIQTWRGGIRNGR